MSSEAWKKAMDFMENEKQFHLGFLPTEQSSPVTKNLDRRFAESTESGVRNLQEADRAVLPAVRRIFASKEFEQLVNECVETVRSGGRIVFSGCGATGRLAIVLESMWRTCCARHREFAAYAENVSSIMTGGDYALVRAVESFEDYEIFGRRQVCERKMGPGDLLLAITEGGETSSVLGTVFEALDRGSKVFLMFNNPADLLAEHLERSRRAIRDPRVRVLDLSCGPMALSGSTRMQATTSEQLVSGAALEAVLNRLRGTECRDAAADFENLLSDLEQPASLKAIAAFLDFEAAVYKRKGLVTYFADDCLLDIFTDTTERSPTFMLPPFRGCDDNVSPRPWTFVKDPLHTTSETWRSAMLRPLRCLNWNENDYAEMNAPEKLRRNPPAIGESELLKFEIGRESLSDRSATGRDAALLITIAGAPKEKLLSEVFGGASVSFFERRHLSIGEGPGDFVVPCRLPESPLDLTAHLAVKLVLNTVSTGAMVVLGRVAGNWMSYVALTNKKLVDRGIRLVAELGNMDYREACLAVFEAMEELAASRDASREKESVVQYVLRKQGRLSPGK